MATIIETSGFVVNIEPKNGSDFSLNELQGFVNGFIEIVPLNDEFIMVVNEEWKLKNLGINHLATFLYHEMNPYAVNDVIVGNVLVCRTEEVK